MTFSSLHACLQDLEKNRMLLRIRSEVDPDLDMAEMHRQVFLQNGPALLFEKVKGSPFPATSNLFGTWQRVEFIFRKTLKQVQKVVALKADPTLLLKNPLRFANLPFTLLHALPKPAFGVGKKFSTCQISDLPQIKCWPKDGGAFITLPQVLSQDVDKPGIFNANLGMYRIQLGGNQYEQNKQIGLHYQIHRGIGVHHAKALRRDLPFRISIFVGGPPAHQFCAILPLPEGLSEVLFAGMFSGRRFRYGKEDGYILSADADFCITGKVSPTTKLPEGPFGDHLGYYSLAHDFPVLEVEKVYHRKGAIWPFTVVGRPPQEDSYFGKLIHEIVGPMVPKQISGLKALHAVDAAGVHPLLLAIGSERYTPYEQDNQRPEELLTIANAILGFGQCSLAKYLLVAGDADDPHLDIHKVDRFFQHILQRVNWQTDLHFQTQTTMDTLDYSGTGLNAGSKVVIAVRGKPRRRLATQLDPKITTWGALSAAKFAMPGVLIVGWKGFSDYLRAEREIAQWSASLFDHLDALSDIPMIVMVDMDEVEFCAQNLQNFLWLTFTRSNPSHDIYGLDSFYEHKHWGCRGSLVIDARRKPHHAPALASDPASAKRAREILHAHGFKN